MLDQNVPNPLAKNPNFHTHKVFAAIGIILIVAIVIVGGIWYFVQSALDKVIPDEFVTNKVSTSSAKISTTSAVPADWNVYENTKYSYSLKYPQYLHFGGSPETTTDKLTLTNGENDSYKFPENKFIGIRILIITTEKSLDDFLKETYPENQAGIPAFETGIQNGKINKTSIDNISGYQSPKGMQFENTEKTAWVKKGNFVYQITAFGNGETGTSYSENAGKLFDQILSTFKFL